MWRSNWNSVIGTDVFLQAETIRHMYDIAIEEYPDKQFTFKNAKGIKNVKVVEESNCQIRLGSMQRPKSLRSGSYKMAHFSETALWTTTEYTKPEDLISSIVSAIPFIPYTIIVNESTAKGEGNYFHRQWLRAIREESGFCPVFVAWWEIEIYSLPFASDEEKITFYNNLDDYGKFLWSLGATLESIHWYKDFQKGQGFEDWQMHEEYPSIWQESFIASGERVIPLKYMSVLQKYLRTPEFVGDIHADGKKNAEALQNIQLLPNTQSGCLQIWEYPDKNNRFSNRYVVSMDIGGRSSKADYTVIRVLDRYWRTEGGVDEFVATWRGHGDVDLLVWKAYNLLNSMIMLCLSLKAIPLTANTNIPKANILIPFLTRLCRITIIFMSVMKPTQSKTILLPNTDSSLLRQRKRLSLTTLSAVCVMNSLLNTMQ